MAEAFEWILQAAAIPIFRDRLCLVTSRNSKRWVIPKGCLEEGKTAGELALLEAWEEAGLVGLLDAEPLGSYQYAKLGSIHLVTVFRMQVTEAAKDWPERRERQRIWVPPHKALSRLQDPGLREIVRMLASQPAPIAS